MQRPRQGIGWQLWDASQHLASIVADNSELVTDRTVLELGAGCGLCGLTAAAVGARSVLLTDTALVVPSLQEAIDRNRHVTGSCPVRSAVLDWTEPVRCIPAEAPDVILVSDCTYWKHLFLPLYRTILLLVQKNTLVLIAHKARRPHVEEEAFELLARAFVFKSLRAGGCAAGNDCIRIDSLTLRDDIDLMESKESAMADIAFEAADPASLLARLCSIEEDMESIVAE